ncbi:secreted RxLR effector protein 161-like [Rutidosis leptorrhynchoides]|uniref:secreted RxLR effector protein 161-like n=1 Tax=Rutidosis leptorrhynchoides TaxID=125765 RepID=UPI003A9A43D5
MEQPLGFIDSRFPSHVCRLKKALYGLKQAPRAWFQRLSTFLTQLGFVCSRADPSLFVYKKGTCLAYLLVYVDDLILTGINQVSQFLQAPTIDHFQAVKRIIRYIKGTIVYGLHFQCAVQPYLVGYSDADWARCIETGCSTYGYSIFLGGKLVSWSAKKQPTVARSSCESEYRALANTAAEII